MAGQENRSNTPLEHRQQRRAEIIARGEADSLEILTADFGHWPPRGLRISRPPQGRVSIRSAYNIAAHVRDYTGPVAQAPASVLAQRAAVWALAPVLLLIVVFSNAVGFIRKDGRNRTLFMKHIRTGKLANTPENTLAHEHIHILQNDRMLRKEPSAFDGEHVKGLYTPNEKLDDKDKKKLAYYGEETEIQARMHCVLTYIYQKTQTMPVTRADLLDVLWYSDMLPMPLLGKTLNGQPLIDFIVNDPELNEWKNARDRMLAQGIKGQLIDAQAPDAMVTYKDIGEIGSVYRKLVPGSLKARFRWQALPLIYADLLEIYGDIDTAEAIRDEVKKAPVPEIK